MKTKTIYNALLTAKEDAGFYGRNMDGTLPTIARIRIRQIEKFTTALLSRIEAGDRAREALKQVEWVSEMDYDATWRFCPWCIGGVKQGHAPDCPRQLALGIKEG